MAVSRVRLELCLRLLPGSEWERFEHFCSQFLISDYPELRTTANAAGDGGRDAFLFSDGPQSNVAFQFSLQWDWRDKVRLTAKRVKTTHPNVTVLVFMSNQQIGAAGDDLRRELSQIGIYLDIRDRLWFLERFDSDPTRIRATQELIDSSMVSGLDAEGIASQSTVLTRSESKTLLLFLELQRSDEVAEKGLTRSCFEALVRAALRDTSSRSRASRQEIYSRVSSFLPEHDPIILRPYVDAALKRLAKTVIKHRRDSDDYHMAYEESVRLTERAAYVEALRLDFEADVRDIVSSDPRIGVNDRDSVSTYIAQLVEAYLHLRGEHFAAAVTTGGVLFDSEAELDNVMTRLEPPILNGGVNGAVICRDAFRNLLRTPSERALAYLKLLSDCYTLFSFLAETPNVQKAVKRIFTRGDIWLDTSVLLPAFAEFAEKHDDAISRPFSNLLSAISDTGTALHVTTGVLEEVERHINRCRTYCRTDRWTGDVPYVVGRYLIAGGTKEMFVGFSELFCDDNARAVDDIAIFLKEEFGVAVTEPQSDPEIPETIRLEILSFWQDIQSARRHDTMTSMLLARHDADNYINILSRRLRENRTSWLGYSSWWLTLDSYARRFFDSAASDEARKFIVHQPIISMDFLAQHLTFGSLLGRAKVQEVNPLQIFGPAIKDTLPREIIERADELRKQFEGVPERIKIRRIRNELDRQRATYGEVHKGGVDGLPAVVSSRGN